MPPMTQRRLRALETKKRILETALHLFETKGWENTTVDEIVETAGTSKGAFYNHFESKDSIFEEKFKEIDGFYVWFLDTLPAGLSSREKILKLIDGQMQFIVTRLGKDLVRMIYANAILAKSSKTLGNRERPLYQIVETFIDQGVNLGEFRLQHSVREMALLITRTMRAAIYDWCLFENEIDLVRDGQKLTRYVLDGFMA